MGLFAILRDMIPHGKTGLGGNGDPFDRLSREQYDEITRASIRRGYMDLAEGDIYSTVFRGVSIEPDATILDRGCGDAKDIITLAKEHGHTGPIIGIETAINGERKISDIDVRLKSNGVTNAHIIEGDAQDLAFEDNSIDVILDFSVLQHVVDIHAALAESKRVLKPGGLHITITNGIENKPVHHGYLADMIDFINNNYKLPFRAIPPPPLSSRFTAEMAAKVLPRYEQIRHEYKQGRPGNLKIDDSVKVNMLLSSLWTYLPSVMPNVPEDWPEEAKAEAKQELIEAIHESKAWRHARDMIRNDVTNKIVQNGAVYETIVRRAFVGRQAPKVLSLIR